GFAAERLLPDGSLDTSFNGTGQFEYTFPNPDNVQTPRGLALGANGNIVLAGWHNSYVPGSGTTPPAWGVVEIQPSIGSAFLRSTHTPIAAHRPTAAAFATPDPAL